MAAGKFLVLYAVSLFFILLMLDVTAAEKTVVIQLRTVTVRAGSKQEPTPSTTAAVLSGETESETETTKAKITTTEESSVIDRSDEISETLQPITEEPSSRMTGKTTPMLVIPQAGQVALKGAKSTAIDVPSRRGGDKKVSVKGPNDLLSYYNYTGHEWWWDSTIDCPIYGNGSTFKPFHFKYCLYGLEISKYRRRDRTSGQENRDWVNQVHFKLVYNGFDGGRVKIRRTSGALKRICDDVVIDAKGASYGIEKLFSAGIANETEMTVELFFACCKTCEEFNQSVEGLILYLGRLHMLFTSYSTIYYEETFYDNQQMLYFRDSLKYAAQMGRLPAIDFYSFGLAPGTNPDGKAPAIEAPTCYNNAFELTATPLGEYVCAMAVSIPLKGVLKAPKRKRQRKREVDIETVVYIGHASDIPPTFQFECAERYTSHQDAEVTSKPITGENMTYCWDSVTLVKAMRVCCSYGVDARFTQSQLAFREPAVGDVPLFSNCLYFKYFLPWNRANSTDFTFETARKGMDDVMTPMLRRRFSDKSITVISNQQERVRYCSLEVITLQNTSNASLWKTVLYSRPPKELSVTNLKHEIGVAQENVTRLVYPFRCSEVIIESSILHRLLPIVCHITYPRFAGCDHDAERNASETSMLCCCTGDFCNVQRNMMMLAHYNPKPLCKYNNLYQHIYQRYLSPQRRVNFSDGLDHSCYIHIPAFALFKNENDPDDSFIEFEEQKFGHPYNILPGSNYYLSDDSYDTLAVGTCNYIEFSLNPRYINARRCSEETVEEVCPRSAILPVNLFVCRCETKSTSGKLCDEQLENDLKTIVPPTPKVKCLIYDNLTYEKAVRVTLADPNYVSRVCITIAKIGGVSFDFGTSLVDYTLNLQLFFTGASATSSLADKFGSPLDVIGYSRLTFDMRNGARDPTSRCITFEGQSGAKRELSVRCYCRPSSEGDNPCNDRREITLARNVLYDYIHAVRFDPTTDRNRTVRYNRRVFSCKQKLFFVLTYNKESYGPYGKVTESKQEYGCVYDEETKVDEKPLLVRLCLHNVIRNKCLFSMKMKQLICCCDNVVHCDDAFLKKRSQIEKE